jgi:hypothetical protein
VKKGIMKENIWITGDNAGSLKTKMDICWEKKNMIKKTSMEKGKEIFSEEVITPLTLLKSFFAR